MKRTIAAAAGALALFHGWVFGSQLWAGQLSEPGLIARWLLAGGLIAGIVLLHRSGESIFWGRKTVSIWLLAALLHGPAMADGQLSALDQPSLPEVATVMLQVVASTLLGLGLALASRSPQRITTGLSSRAFATIGLRVARDRRLSRPFTPRPPPRHQ
jgi:hydrogenase/urease accessory protein HupE